MSKAALGQLKTGDHFKQYDGIYRVTDDATINGKKESYFVQLIARVKDGEPKRVVSDYISSMDCGEFVECGKLVLKWETH